MLAYRSAFSADGPVDQVAPAVRDVMVDWAEKKHRKKLGPDGLGALAPGVRLQPQLPAGPEVTLTPSPDEVAEAAAALGAALARADEVRRPDPGSHRGSRASARR